MMKIASPLLASFLLTNLVASVRGQEPLLDVATTSARNQLGSVVNVTPQAVDRQFVASSLAAIEELIARLGDRERFSRRSAPAEAPAVPAEAPAAAVPRAAPSPAGPPRITERRQPSGGRREQGQWTWEKRVCCVPIYGRCGRIRGYCRRLMWVRVRKPQYGTSEMTIRERLRDELTAIRNEIIAFTPPAGEPNEDLRLELTKRLSQAFAIVLLVDRLK